MTRGRMNGLSVPLGVILCDCIEGLPSRKLSGEKQALEGAEWREIFIELLSLDKFSFTRGKGLDLPHLPNCPQLFLGNCAYCVHWGSGH